MIRGHLSSSTVASEGLDNETKDLFHTTAKHVKIATEQNAVACSTMLATYVFGILVPPLLLLIPLSSWLNLCALQ